MKVKNVVGACKDFAKKVFKKHGAKILVIVGSAGTVGAGVWAVRNTVKYDVKGILTNAKNEIDAISDRVANEGEEYSRVDGRKDTWHVVGQTAKKLGKVYGGPIGLELGSLGGIGLGLKIIVDEAASLAVACAGIESAFMAYRERTAEILGPEVEEQIRYSLHKEKVQRIETDEDGNEIVLEEEIDVSDYDGYSETARFFNETTSDIFHGIPTEGSKETRNFLPSTIELQMFLGSQQNISNAQLFSKGILTLNDVYESLGLERTLQGLTLGWVKGDYVQFIVKPVSRPVVDKDTHETIGWDPDILIDFNCREISWFLKKAEAPKRIKLV